MYSFYHFIIISYNVINVCKLNLLTFEFMNMYSVVCENKWARFYHYTIIVCCVVLYISVSTYKYWPVT